MAKNRIKIGRDVVGVVYNKGFSFVQAGDPVNGPDVRAAIADLLRVTQADSELPPEQGAEVRERARQLQAETTAKSKHWNRRTLRDLLTDLSSLAATTTATAGAVEAVRESLGPMIR